MISYSNDFIEIAAKVKTYEDLERLARENGVEMPAGIKAKEVGDEDLDLITGGGRGAEVDHSQDVCNRVGDNFYCNYLCEQNMLHVFPNAPSCAKFMKSEW